MIQINKEQFAASLVGWRKGEGMTQKELAELVQSSQSALCEIEKAISLPAASTILGFYAYTEFDILDALLQAMVEKDEKGRDEKGRETQLRASPKV